MLVKAMEVSGIEGNFRSTCENVMQVLRLHKDSVMAMMEVTSWHQSSLVKYFSPSYRTSVSAELSFFAVHLRVFSSPKRSRI